MTFEEIHITSQRRQLKSIGDWSSHSDVVAWASPERGEPRSFSKIRIDAIIFVWHTGISLALVFTSSWFGYKFP